MDINLTWLKFNPKLGDNTSLCNVGLKVVFSRSALRV